MVIYEINAWTWLHDLSRRLGRRIQLDSVPRDEWDRLAAWGFDTVWLMGVWERSPVGALIAREEQGLEAVYRAALPGYAPDDVVGSPYCVHNYVVDKTLGGPEGLAAARAALNERGLRLLLDFVPNHVAPDHPWIREHPEYFIEGTDHDLIRDPRGYFASYGRVLASGRDPYFPAWTDTAQLNAFSPGLRRAAVETLWSIARQCDGVRCDMAMLLLTSVFEKTWGVSAGQRPSTEYWTDVIPAVRSRHAQFVFIAEAYWDLEWQLQQFGFDYCYDKRLYDRLEHSSAEEIRLHLCAQLEYQQGLLRFIENHDEPRAAATLAPARSRAAAVTICTIPGAVLLHDGQFEGRRIKALVQLRRWAEEPADAGLAAFYRRLLSAMRNSAVRRGQWQLCERWGWPDNSSYRNIVAWSWTSGHHRSWIIVNLSAVQSQAKVKAPWTGLSGSYRLADSVQDQQFERGAEDMQDGLFVDLPPWAFHIFQVTPS